jgi:hypothetical protein
MTTQFNLRNFRILTVGGAKASTNGQLDEPDEEPGIDFYKAG